MEESCASGLFTVRIPEVFSHYKTICILEKGGFSVVIQAQDTKTHKFVACKIVSRDGLTKNGLFNRFEQELRIQETLDHPNIAKIKDVVYYTDIIIVVLDYFVNKDMLSFMTEVAVVTKSDSIRIMQKLVSAVAYLHQRNIAHRDIKLENIVLDNALDPVLIDFGACTSSSSLRTTLVGSHYYIPPEVWFHKEYDAKAADVWALGVTCFVIITGSFPWGIGNESQIMDMVSRGDFEIPKIEPPEMDLFVRLSIVVDPMKRAKIEQLEEVINKYEDRVSRLPALKSCKCNSEKPYFCKKVVETLNKKAKSKRNILKASGVTALRLSRSGVH